MKLTATDVDCVDPSGTALQQHIREPAGGRADVDRRQAVDGEAETVEGVRQLVSAAAHVGFEAADLQRRRLIYQLSWLQSLLAADGDGTGHDECLGLLAALGQASLCQK